MPPFTRPVRKTTGYYFTTVAAGAEVTMLSIPVPLMSPTCFGEAP